MAPAGDLLPGRDAGLHEGLEDVAARVAAVLGVVGKVPALGRDEDLVPGDAALLDGAGQGASDRPLAPLAPVVDRGVEDVDPESSFPRYVPSPIEESRAPIASRKWPGAEAEREANRPVPSRVARPLITTEG
jgi:hypothetical protein